MSALALGRAAYRVVNAAILVFLLGPLFVVAVFALSIVVLTVLRALRYRPAAVLCGLAAGLATAGLAVLAVLLAAAVPAGAAPGLRDRLQ